MTLLLQEGHTWLSVWTLQQSEASVIQGALELRSAGARVAVELNEQTANAQRFFILWEKMTLNEHFVCLVVINNLLKHMFTADAVFKLQFRTFSWCSSWFHL